jgi:hypothetical protein
LSFVCRHNTLDHILEKVVLPLLDKQVRAAYVSKQLDFEGGLLTNVNFWPADFGDLLPCTHKLEADTLEHNQLEEMANHVPPKGKSQELCEFARSLPGHVEEETYMIRGTYMLDELRVQVAKALFQIIALRSEPTVVNDPTQGMPVEIFVISNKTLDVMRDLLKHITIFGSHIQVETKNLTAIGLVVQTLFKKMVDDANSWQRLLVKECKSRWEGGIARLKANLDSSFPADWESFCVVDRNEERILEELCNNLNLDRLLPSQVALRDGLATFEKGICAIGSDGLSQQEKLAIEALIHTAKKVLGVRAASTVTLLRLPAATNSKSRQAFVRECKRLICALQIDLPPAVLNAMDTAAAAGISAASAEG